MILISQERRLIVGDEIAAWLADRELTGSLFTSSLTRPWSRCCSTVYLPLTIRAHAQPRWGRIARIVSMRNLSSILAGTRLVVGVLALSAVFSLFWIIMLPA